VPFTLVPINTDFHAANVNVPEVNGIKDMMGRAVNLLHRTVLRITGGRVANKGFGMPVVMLETVGRKTGKRRTTVLTSPLQEDGKVIVVASWGGDDRNPQWYLNLCANPEVELTMEGKTRTVKARTASAEERAELWPKVVDVYKGYGQYQTKTDREIPLVILEG
jgi:deazaflavin-dependent oxidoreductase (nitroreductase family)